MCSRAVWLRLRAAPATCRECACCTATVASAPWRVKRGPYPENCAMGGRFSYESVSTNWASDLPTRAFPSADESPCIVLFAPFSVVTRVELANRGARSRTLTRPWCGCYRVRAACAHRFVVRDYREGLRLCGAYSSPGSQETVDSAGRAPWAPRSLMAPQRGIDLPAMEGGLMVCAAASIRTDVSDARDDGRA